MGVSIPTIWDHKKENWQSAEINGCKMNSMKIKEFGIIKCIQSYFCRTRISISLENSDLKRKMNPLLKS